LGRQQRLRIERKIIAITAQSILKATMVSAETNPSKNLIQATWVVPSPMTVMGIAAINSIIGT
jgi:hypothetical protein